MAATITVAGWGLYPAEVQVTPMLIGGGINRSINGKGFRKVLGEKQKVEMLWPVLTAEEAQDLRIVWTAAKQGTVTISCSDPYVSGTFLLADPEFKFKRIEGSNSLYAGSMTFEEQ